MNSLIFGISKNEMQQSIIEKLNALSSISLKELDSLRLMNRVDTKFVFHLDMLSDILHQIQDDYKILEIDNKRIFKYESLYFDTPNFSHYMAHHNGKPNRIKVRYRKYTDSGDVFFEIKKRIKDSRTDKHRVKLDTISTKLNGIESNLMSKHSIVDEGLEDKIWIFYDRITLASLYTNERVTIDLSMKFDTTLKQKDFPTLVVAEVKQDKFSRVSKFVNVLRKYNIPEFRISKYAIAIAMMEDGIKMNAFKEKINRLNKITQ